MAVQLNVPGSSEGGAGPVAVYDFFPVSDIASVQGGINLYQPAVGGISAFVIDATSCQCDLLIQFFMQDSPVGQPMLSTLKSGQKQAFNFTVKGIPTPVDFMIISNLSGNFPLPFGLSQRLAGSRLPAATGGFIVISGLDTDLETFQLQPPLQQVPLLDTGNFVGSSPATFQFPIDGSIQTLVLNLIFAANIDRIIVFGITGLAGGSNVLLYDSFGPFLSSDTIAIPLMNAFGIANVAIDVYFHATGWRMFVTGRRDAFNVYQTPPLAANTIALTAAFSFFDQGSAFTLPNFIFGLVGGFIASMQALAQQNAIAGMVGVRGVTSNKELYLASFGEDALGNGAAQWSLGGPLIPLALSTPINCKRAFPSDSQLITRVAWNSINVLQPNIYGSLLTN